MATTKVITQIAGMLIGATYDNSGNQIQRYYATKEELAAAVTSAVRFKGTVTYQDLNGLNDDEKTVGDLYNVSNAFGMDSLGVLVPPSTSLATVYDAGTNVVWDGERWDVYGSASVDLTPYAINNDVVHKAGSETITGAKTFIGGLSVLYSDDANSKKVTLGLNPLNANRAIKFPDRDGTLAIDNGLVHDSGNEEINGSKTFLGTLNIGKDEAGATATLALHYLSTLDIYGEDFSQIVRVNSYGQSYTLQDALDAKANVSNIAAGTYKSVTVNSDGIVTSGSNPTTLAGYGITDAKIENGVITLGSNTITPLTSHQSLSNYVTLNTDQIIAGVKTFQNGLYASQIYIQQTYGNTEYGGWFGVITQAEEKRGLMYIYDETNSRQFEFPNEGSTIQSIATKEWSNANVGVLKVTEDTTGKTLTIAGNSTTQLNSGNSVTITYVTVTTSA